MFLARSIAPMITSTEIDLVIGFSENIFRVRVYLSPHLKSTLPFLLVLEYVSNALDSEQHTKATIAYMYFVGSTSSYSFK